MVQALDQIQGVDNTQNWLAATRAGITDRQLQQNYAIQAQNHLMRQNVGNALAGENPDMPDSQKQALQGGDFDLYGQLHGWAQKASDEEHATIQKQHELTANLLANIKTPQQLEMALGVAQSTKDNDGNPVLSPDDAAQIRRQVQQFGLEPTMQHYQALVGRQNDIIQAAQAQRQQAYKDIGQVAAQYQGDPDRWLAEGVPALKQAGYNVDDVASPAGLQIAIARAGLGSDVMRNQAKADLAGQKAASGGGKQSALSQATQNVIEGTLKRYPNLAKEDVPLDLAQAAAAARGTLEFDGDHWALMNPDGSTAAIRKQMADTMAKRYDPNVTAQNAYARKGSEANVKLDAQLNRLASVKEQIQQIRDMVGEEGSPERADMESSLGYVNNHVGKQYWGSGNVPAVMGVLGSKISTLQDELAQYVQTSGAGSDVRAKKAYDVVGDLQNSRDVPTLLKRLDGIEETIGSLKKVPRVNAASGGLNKPESDENLPTLTPEQAMKAAPGTRFKSSDGRILTRH